MHLQQKRDEARTATKDLLVEETVKVSNYNLFVTISEIKKKYKELQTFLLTLNRIFRTKMSFFCKSIWMSFQRII